MANMNIQKVLTEYAEEVSLKEMDRIRQNRKAEEKDPLWDTWYEMAGKYEPKTIIKEDEEPASKKKSAKKKVSGKAKARRQREATIDKKVKMQRNVVEIVKNFAKRMAEDCRNHSSVDGRTSYCKKRGGSNVLEPKSQLLKTARILKRARKMGLIDESIKYEAEKIMIFLGIIEDSEKETDMEKNDGTKQQKVENIEEAAA